MLKTILFLLFSTTLMGQTLPPAESARHWEGRGKALMAGGQFAKAYSAFQLARSLGASGMVARMEEARRRNMNHIMLQSLMAEARGLTETDPVQAMRLLEHAHRYFPDSSRILQELGTLVNRPNLWLSNLKAAQLWHSPTLRYVVAAGSPARLYACRGDSLTNLFTFTTPVENVFFAPGDRYVWVATVTGTLLLDCQSTGARMVRQLPDIMQGAVCSPDGRYMLASFQNDAVNRLYRVRNGQLEKTDVVANPKQSIFSPDGHFLCLLATEGLVTVRQLYRLAPDGPQLVYNITAQQPLRDATFSPDGRWLLMESKTRNTVEMARLDPDSVRLRLFSDCHIDRLTEAFSGDGRWLLLSFFGSSQDSLWAVTPDSLHLRHVFGHLPGTPEPTQRILSRFSPEGSWLLRGSSSERPEAQCWSLRGSAPRLLHQFTHKNGIQYDEFSADGRYLLSHHLQNDSLWRCSEVGLVPVHGFQNALRRTDNATTNPTLHPRFSPDSRLLLTYSSGAALDSLWQIRPDRLTPLYGFRERLSAVFTLFSPNCRWLLSGGNTLTDKVLYSTALLWPLHQPQLDALLHEARFSESGQYLLGRSVALDSATVLYRIRAGQLTLVQKLRLPFWIGESRFLSQDRFLLTYHESFTLRNLNQGANYIWRITDDGLTPFYRFLKPYIRSLRQLGDFRSFRQLGGTRQLIIERRLLVAPDGNHFFTHTGGNVADSLWQLTDAGVTPMRPVEPTATGLFSFQRGNDNIQTPGAGFIGSYFWQTKAMGNRVTLQPIQPGLSTAYSLPEGADYLFGFSPRTGLAVFAPRIFEGPVLHIYRGGQWRALRSFPGSASDYQEGKKPGEPSSNVLSSDGRLLFIKTADRLWVYLLNGSAISLLHTQAGVFQRFAFVPADAEGANTNGVVFSNLNQTFWLHLGASGVRVIRLGEGVLEQPPTIRNGLLYFTRRLTDGQVVVDVLQPTTGIRLAQHGVQQFLDLTIRPDGTVWIMTKQGLEMLYIPSERLAWLNRVMIAPLSVELKTKYVFE